MKIVLKIGRNRSCKIQKMDVLNEKREKTNSLQWNGFQRREGVKGEVGRVEEIRLD